ncbi:MAG TPA: hypothetical protein DEG17_18735 [Cyanobacteria bacterium UBA11149]|nr:hypothetical protein [Cyanobacteria bacterium UBA11367]HBE56170.1 hypothetical protein [Cyanobacteria bacterium UBA11366]HBK62191.1 hypothetical protein [Cyanobacteria bacterium UBA11166]HBR73900.1 hypothetical protein [Cyanobacteria bacterium UBA11159]HBS70215.1 hypothetical protein [Cyanobacteria bacterium UBA11153]HBW90848.1 hypothetical protein [Cyanobacteria bacterium UBA11149]HCA96342.1 hypothetical protein [Cyanobacteria bacterium UBA9226]
MPNISSKDLKPHPLSMVDRNGRLFWFNDQLYRGISSDWALFYRNLFELGIVQELIQEDLLVETEITNLHSDEWAMILNHKIIPFVTYPHEWCDLMLKDAALLILDLNLKLNKYDLINYDPRILNILFNGCKPIYVDFCSIVSVNDRKISSEKTYEKFRMDFLTPLELMSKGCYSISRSLMKDNYYRQNKLIQELAKLKERDKSDRFGIDSLLKKIIKVARRYTPGPIRPWVKNRFVSTKRSLFFKNQKSHSDFLNRLKAEVENIKIPSLNIQQSNCYDNFFSSFVPSDKWTAKQESIQKIFSELKPNSVLDTDSDRGWYSQLAGRCGSQVVAFDEDEACASKLYIDSKKNNLSVIPLVMDWTSQHSDLSNDYFSSIKDRLKCDLVLSLTLMQHLTLKSHINLEQTLIRLSHFSKRWVLIEFISHPELEKFIPPEAQYVYERWQNIPQYTMDEFVNIIKSQFPEVKIFPSSSETRKLLLCDKVPSEPRFTNYQ